MSFKHASFCLKCPVSEHVCKTCFKKASFALDNWWHFVVLLQEILNVHSGLQMLRLPEAGLCSSRRLGRRRTSIRVRAGRCQFDWSFSLKIIVGLYVHNTFLLHVVVNIVYNIVSLLCSLKFCLFSSCCWLHLRNVMMNVMFRWETRTSDNQVCHNLFGHPSIIKLPNHLPGHSLHAAVLRMVPNWSTMKNYTIVVTNSKVINL